jgi:hypothetical protein
MKIRVFGFRSVSESGSLSVLVFAQYVTADTEPDSDADPERIGYHSVFEAEGLVL